MKKGFPVLLAFLFMCSMLFAQTSPSAGMPHSLITGTTADSSTGAPLPGVSIMAVSLSDNKVLSGTISDDKGHFSLKLEKPDEFRIKFSIIGYKDKFISTPLKEKERNAGIGVVKLSSSALMLSEVQIKGQRPMIEYYVDKQVINMEKVPGTPPSVSDALRNTGLVDVDPSTKKISLRGSEGVTIQIDGKPMPMAETMLSQMPVSYVDRVEIKTNPSSKDDPEGDAGIINIITKKNDADNYNGSVSLYTTSQNLAFGSAAFNYRKNRYNFFSSVNAYGGSQEMHRSFNKVNYGSSVLHSQRSSSINKMKGFMGGVKLGLDFDPDKENSLSVSGTYNNMQYDVNDNTDNYNFRADDIFNYYYNLRNDNDNFNENYIFTGFYKRRFDQKGHEVNTDIYYSRLHYGYSSDMATMLDYLPDRPQLQDNDNDVTNNTFIISSDYTNPTEKSGRFEAGYKYTFRDRNTDYDISQYSYRYNQWRDSLNYSNLFKYKENIFALYLTYSNKFSIFDYKAGFRAEQTYADGDQVTTGIKFSNNYFSYFPSFTLSYKFSDMFQATFNAARRITRPQVEMINPFVRINGPNNISVGNPKLNPTYVNLFELGVNPLIKFYYTFAQGRPQFIVTNVDDSVTVSSAINLSNTKTYGIELTIPLINQPKSPVKLPSWISMINVGVTYYKLTEYGRYLNEIHSVKRDNWRINANANFNIIFDINASVYYRWSPKSNDGRYINYSNSSLTVSLSRSFFNRKLQFSLSGNDLLNSSRYRTETFGSNYYSDMRFTVPRSRSIALAVSFMFNDFKQKRERQIDDGRDNTEGGLMR